MTKTLLKLLLLYGVVVGIGFGLYGVHHNDPMRVDYVARAELRKHEMLGAFPRQEGNPDGSFSLGILDTLAGELVIEDVAIGSGPVARSGDYIAVHYRAMFENGEVFDSSRSPGRNSFQFQLGVGQVIRGWDEGIPGMRVGGIRRLVVPSTKAYGPEGFGPIPGGATLIYEIELLSVFN
jgi:hypothetical protein